MRTAAQRPRENRTITVDCRDEATSLQRLGAGKACVACVCAFLLALGLPLLHTAPCDGGGGLPRHAHDARVRRGGVTSWRRQGTPCTAVCTVLPHVILRDRQRRPEGAREALVATHGGRRVELGAVLSPLSPLTRSRLIGACGPQSLVPVLPRGGVPLPVSCLADDKPRRARTAQGSLPTLVGGRVLGHCGDTAAARTTAFPPSDRALPPAARPPAPAERVRGLLTAGCASPPRPRSAAPRSRRGPPHGWRARRLGARPCAPRATPCSPGHARARAWGGCAGPQVAALCRPRRHPGGSGPGRTGAARGAGEAGGLVGGPGSPPEARDQHAAGPGPDRPRTAAVRHARLPSSGGEGVSELLISSLSEGSDM
jgi:hypothetical protein